MLVRENLDGRAPALTPRLFMLKEGDRLQHRREDHRPLHARTGEAGRHVIFLGTGTGEAPHNYMLWELLRTRPHREDPLAPAASATRATSATCDTHTRLMGRYPNYKYLALTTREAER